MTNIIFQTGSEDFGSDHALAVAIFSSFFLGGGGGKVANVTKTEAF